MNVLEVPDLDVWTERPDDMSSDVEVYDYLLMQKPSGVVCMLKCASRLCRECPAHAQTTNEALLRCPVCGFDETTVVKKPSQVSWRGSYTECVCGSIIIRCGSHPGPITAIAMSRENYERALKQMGDVI